ncbi:chorismate mutase [Streptomyces sp. NBC_01497]|uniref:chorismate mutase n=1 Tax=Streptomyces sp. NBC_01497 TaxID=2903885 RepID=UPI002E36D571|nr:chorismate mutase [Streptomyces sp. NBC_01497]
MAPPSPSSPLRLPCRAALLSAAALAAGIALAAAPAGSSAAAHGSGPEALAAAASLGSAGSLGPLGPLTELAIRRIQLGSQVAAAKRGTGSPVDDPAREEQELAKVRQQAEQLGLDAGTTARFFEDQIAASKVVQRGLLARWNTHPGEAPAERPSLAAIRTELDAITQRILRELVATDRARRPSARCAAALAEAAASGAAAHRLDALHREALGTALRSVCTAATE